MRRPLWLRLTGHYPHLMRDGLLTTFSGHSGLIGYTGLMFWFPAEEILGIVPALERLSSTRHATVGHAKVAYLDIQAVIEARRAAPIHQGVSSLSRVIGRSRMRMPVAWCTALAIAAAVPTIPTSPRPFDPIGLTYRSSPCSQ